MKIKWVSLERLFCVRRNMSGQIPVPNACCLDLGAASVSGAASERGLRAEAAR